MPKRTKRIERRKYKRFRVPKNAYVLLRPNGTEVGKIIDISPEGLSFDYAGSEQLSSELSELDILITDNGFRLNNLPYKAVSSIETYESPLGSVSKKRCGVQFGGLTQSQISQLKHFIERYASSETSD
jgi:hypothetical protein